MGNFHSNSIVCFILLCLAGCMTPPGKLRDEDFAWKEQTISANYNEIYKRLITGFRTCGPEELGKKIGMAECFVYQTDSSILCDVYLGGGLTNRRTDLVIGRIYVKGVNDQLSNIKVGGRIMGFNDGTHDRDIWLEFANGQIRCLDQSND